MERKVFKVSMNDSDIDKKFYGQLEKAVKSLKTPNEDVKKRNKKLPYPPSHNVGDVIKAKVTIINSKDLTPKKVEFKGEIVSKKFTEIVSDVVFLLENENSKKYKCGYWSYVVKMENSEKRLTINDNEIIEVYFNNFGIH